MSLTIWIKRGNHRDENFHNHDISITRSGTRINVRIQEKDESVAAGLGLDRSDAERLGMALISAAAAEKDTDTISVGKIVRPKLAATAGTR